MKNKEKTNKINKSVYEKIILIALTVIVFGGIIAEGIYLYQIKKKQNAIIKAQQAISNPENNTWFMDSNESDRVVESEDQESLPNGWNRHSFEDWGIKFSLAYPDGYTLDSSNRANGFLVIKDGEEYLLTLSIQKDNLASTNNTINGFPASEQITSTSGDFTPNQCQISFEKNNEMLTLSYWGMFQYEYFDYGNPLYGTSQLCNIDKDALGENLRNRVKIAREVVNTIQIY